MDNMTNKNVQNEVWTEGHMPRFDSQVLPISVYISPANLVVSLKMALQQEFQDSTK